MFACGYLVLQFRFFYMDENINGGDGNAGGGNQNLIEVQNQDIIEVPQDVVEEESPQEEEDVEAEVAVVKLKWPQLKLRRKWPQLKLSQKIHVRERGLVLTNGYQTNDNVFSEFGRSSVQRIRLSSMVGY